MKSVLQFFVLALSLTVLAGCGKTNTEKTKDTADTAIAELKSAATQLDAMGTPQATWTDAQFTKYEGLLNTLDAKTTQIEQTNGKDGVYITGTYSLYQMRELVKHNRSVLATKRAEALRTSIADEKRREVTARLQKAGQEFQAEGTPDASWSDDRLNRYEEKLNAVEQVLREAVEYPEMSTKVDGLLKNVASIRDGLKTLRGDRPVKPAA